MLTGLYTPTSGNCWINGLNIRDNMHQIRQNLGICPQHNVLFDMLTVKEHLELFAVLKGTPQHQVAQAVKDKIAEVGLQAKTNVYSKSLSGGMKRKLSVGMALIGDSKTVFLDESVQRHRAAATLACDAQGRRSDLLSHRFFFVVCLCLLLFVVSTGLPRVWILTLVVLPGSC